jgi:hypothetical protein
VRRRRIALVAIGACAVALAFLAWLNRPRDEAARTTVEDAVRLFRGTGDRGGDKSRSAGPALGVYRYATHGFESVGSAIFGTTHDYRGVSTIVLSSGRCGMLERWQVLAGRWTEAESCPGSDGQELRAVTEHHEFFEVRQENSFRCRGLVTSASPVTRPGARFRSSCQSEDTHIYTASSEVGFDRVAVGDKTFGAIHTVSRSLLEGETSGTVRREDWRRRSDGLLLRRSVDAETNTSIAGGLHYGERYTIELLDPDPEY